MEKGEERPEEEQSKHKRKKELCGYRPRQAQGHWRERKEMEINSESVQEGLSIEKKKSHGVPSERRKHKKEKKKSI